MQEENNSFVKDSRLDEAETSEQEIDENLEGSFPASDPPSWTLGTNHRKNSPIKITKQNLSKRFRGQLKLKQSK